jgi:cytochrome c peroxidase
MPRTELRAPPTIVSALIATLACSAPETTDGAPAQPLDSTYVSQLPAGLPEPLVPPDNPTTCDKIALGRYLFYDRQLSTNAQQSCADCHHQDLGFAQDRALPEGSTHQTLPRNSMGLTNVAYRSTYTWANPVLDTLEDQALVPLLGEFPVELGLSGHEAEVLERLAQTALYPPLFTAAFPEDPDPFRLERVVQAIASFERTLLSFDSPYDRFLAGDDSALTPSARRGYDLFFSERAECYHCHAGTDLTVATATTATPHAAGAFNNTGLYNIDGRGTYPSPNVGLIEFTANPKDMGAYRVPTLRNIAVTAPYMHDGSIATLTGVLQHYADGGRTIESGPNAGRGSTSPLKNPLVFRLDLTPDEKSDLVAFLESLTDESFLTNPDFGDPFLGAAAPAGCH